MGRNDSSKKNDPVEPVRMWKCLILMFIIYFLLSLLEYRRIGAVSFYLDIGA